MSRPTRARFAISLALCFSFAACSSGSNNGDGGSGGSSAGTAGHGGSAGSGTTGNGGQGGGVLATGGGAGGNGGGVAGAGGSAAGTAGTGVAGAGGAGVADAGGSAVAGAGGGMAGTAGSGVAGGGGTAGGAGTGPGGAAGNGGAGGAAGATSSGNGGGSPCNSLVNEAPQTTEHRIAENPPATGLGGTIVVGKYFQTDVADYTGPGGSTSTVGPRRQTVTFTATSNPNVFTWQVVRLSNGSDLHETYTLNFSGDTVTFMHTCTGTSAAGSAYHYTVDGDTWTVWSIPGAVRETFVRQP